ncbi:glycine betaine/proline transport system ATP-binding protein [Endozoicomonas montiporae CL-33]|uniref:Quaternary amine transport ATP-binding protein n=1 Tax=Endozoicomonas montiporae CL-33 TaxID=570277 RepID=A0A142BDR7_9GAMM|nr:glycine betaine/L-proline ABC transporter ATP-binding protein [Endozoicomonas montiporae]AMO56893.1 glycine betaine/proline transport system ATP-binding protein [Endozoicomonas montiporae CL-33]
MSNKGEPLISITDLYKIFGAHPEEALKRVRSGVDKDCLLQDSGHTLALQAINLNIFAGEVFVIMGLFGSGKSTLIRHFNRLIEPTSGKLVVSGQDVLQLSDKELVQFRRHRLSMVFQRFALMPHQTILENIAYGLKVQGIKKAERLQQAQQWLETVGLAGYEQHYPSQLSGGQQQRVGLARALCTDADILLMDEAFSALDPLIRSEMQDLLIELQDRLHKTIVFITHDLDEALRLGDRIAILKDGAIQQVGKPEKILLEPATEYVEAFVRDVNRARALTVETVMNPPISRITAKTIGEALDQMKKLPEDYGYYVTEEGYQGGLLQETLEQAARKNAHGELVPDLFEDWPVVTPDMLIEQALPDTLEADHHLPVVDEHGDLQGQLSREALVEVFSESHPVAS